jgi:hypothetical protein
MKIYRLAYEEESRSLAEALHALDQCGAVIISDVPDDEHSSLFLGLAAHFGSLCPHSVLRGHTEKASPHEYVFQVGIRGDPMRTARGTEIKSHTNSLFGWHTDEAFLERPADIILLLCVTPDPHGDGVSGICHIEDVVARLSSGQLMHLSQPIFPHLTGKQPLLRKLGNRWYVRCNLNYLEHAFLVDRFPIDQEAKSAVTAFTNAMNQVSRTCLLKAGECLVLDNLRTLHNRTAFSNNSPRLLKRLRVRRSLDMQPFTGVSTAQQ